MAEADAGRDGEAMRVGVFLALMSPALVASEVTLWEPASPWLASRMVFGGLIPLALGAAVLGLSSLRGLGLGAPRRGALLLAAGLPFTLAAMGVLSMSGSIQAHYGSPPAAPLTLLLAYLPAILQVEICFRGVMLFGLLPRLGPAVALGVSVLPYALVHLDKPLAEALGSVPVGLALGAAALWARSIWYGLVLHLMGAAALTWFVA